MNSNSEAPSKVLSFAGGINEKSQTVANILADTLPDFSEYKNPDFAEICWYGYPLVRIKPGTKGPISKDWSNPVHAVWCFKDAGNLEAAGLLHVETETFDIDQESGTVEYLKAHGVDLFEIVTRSGMFVSTSGPGKYKLWFRAPEGGSRPTVKYCIGRETIF